jgi:hypothetical protein
LVIATTAVAQPVDDPYEADAGDSIEVDLGDPYGMDAEELDVADLEAPDLVDVRDPGAFDPEASDGVDEGDPDGVDPEASEAIDAGDPDWVDAEADPESAREVSANATAAAAGGGTYPKVLQKPALFVSEDEGGSATAQPDLFTGTARYSLPIAVPPGRNGMSPSLALTYRSSNGNGLVGLGWRVEVGAIERSGRLGVTYSGNDQAYLLRLSGAAIELVKIADGSYRAKIEQKFVRIENIGQAWVATDRTGTRYFFGGAAASRQDDPEDATHPRIFKWALDRVVDTDGNEMIFRYQKQRGEIRLHQIAYAGPSPTHLVQFYYEARPDNETPYTTQFRVTTDLRLRTLAVFSEGTLQRAYDLVYTKSPATGRSLLSRVKTYGRDTALDADGVVTGGSLLIEQAFTGQDGGNGGWSSRFLNGPSPDLPVGEFCLDGDLNGDGRGDFWCQKRLGSSDWFISHGTNTGWSQPVERQGPDMDSPIAGQCVVGDFNGDGRSDFTCHRRAGSSRWYMMLGGASGWSLSTWQGPTIGATSDHCLSGDINGDGKTDLWCHRRPGSNDWYLAFSTGSA